MSANPHYINFLQRNQFQIAALSWFEYNAGNKGAIKVTFSLSKVVALDWIPDVSFKSDSIIRDYINRCDFEKAAVVFFEDGALYRFIPDLPPKECYELIKARSQEFMIIKSCF